ncbi:MAG: LysR family transcriptional regulator [Wenzhouxiangella sp.]|nr:LysR family transcriptional regulator [Wenzhouxiangella sp.]
MKINLRHLEAFRTVVTAGTATAAARLLNVSQPAVSQMITQLEETINCPLFHRHRGRLEPTQEGLVFYEEVALAFGNLDRLVDLASRMGRLDVGQLRIVAPPSLAEGLLSQVVARYLQVHPNVQISVDSRSPEAAIEAVAMRSYDCGIGKLPIDHSGLVTEPFVRSETVCALPIDHPLGELERITPRELADEQLILLGKGRSSRARIEEVFREYGVAPRVRLETHTVGAACACAANGLGIAIVNGLMGGLYEDRGIRLRLFSPPIPHEFVFMTSINAPRRRLIGDFFDVFREHLKAGEDHFIKLI